MDRKIQSNMNDSLSSAHSAPTFMNLQREAQSKTSAIDPTSQVCVCVCVLGCEYAGESDACALSVRILW